MSDQNGNANCPCGLRHVLDAHVQDFGRFKRKMEASMEQTASDTKYLRLLPDIQRRVEEQGNSMVQTFSQLSKNLFRLLMALVVFLALIVVIVLVRDSSKDFRATANGISITEPRPFLEPRR